MTLLVMLLTTMTAWAETVTASYIKADGTTSSHSATVINQGNMPTEIGSDFTESWFVVTENVTYDQGIQISGDVHLILSDNTTLSVNGIQIDSGKSLTIYGQSVGDSKGSLCSTGNPGIGGDGCSVTINGGYISANGSYSKAGTIGIGGRWCDITINGGKVYAHGGESGTGIGCPWSAYVNQTGSVTINGGDIQAEVTGIKNMDGSYGSHSAPGICSENIYLNWKRGSDKIMASGCIFEEEDDPITEMHIVGNVVVAPGKTFYTENDNTKTYYSGTLTTEQKNGLGGKTLIPDVSTSFVTSNDGNTYTINDDYGWELFCDALQNNDKGFFDGKTVKLGADIEVTRMAGGSYHDFTGTFDGQGHTLTVNYGTSGSPINEDNAAPFRYVEGCVIRNLHVTGHIYTSKKNAAGIAGTQYEDVSINNCLSSVTIHSSINDGGNNDGTHGGFVGNHGGGTLNIVGCAFTGKMLTTAANKTTRCGGFVGWCNSATNIINCLYAPAAIENGETEVGITESCTFGRYNKATVSLTNCYYTRTLGTAQGKQPRSITSGDTYTTLSNISLSGSTTEYNISGITAYANGGIKRGSTLYYGSGDQVSLTLSHSDHANGTFQGYAANNEALSGSGNPYSLTMPDADVTIRTIWSGSPNFLTRGDGNGTSANPYKITNANDLRDLAIYVNGTGIYSNGITETTAHDCSGKYFKQTFDITLSGEWEPIGANNHQFTGIYDGDNNKISGLTVNGSYMYAGLFGYTHYKTSSYQCVLKNIIVENCDIDVSGLASSFAGGIVGYGGDDTEVKNCRVSGTIKATTSAGGIAGYMWTVTNGHVSKINQCFTDVTVAATKKGKLLGEGTTNGIVDAVLNSKNSYYHDDGSGVTAFGNCGDITYSVPVYTITGVPSGVTIDTEATVNNSGTNYYAAGNVTITVTDASKIFDTFTVSGATYSVDANKKSATVTLAASDATVSATLLSLTGSCGDNATWAVTDTNSDGTYETLTISGTGAITSSPWATDFAAGIKRVNIGSADLSISGNPFSTLGEGAVIVVPTPAYAVSYSSAAYASKLRVALGSYLFTATNEGGTAAYEIANEADLRNLSAAVEATENISVSKTFRQTADISMTGGDFYPIGKRGDNYSFDGTYDGGGHTISGLTVSEDHGYIGLFGYIGRVANHHATVKNVVLVNPSVTATDSDNHAAHVGTVVGFCLQGTIVDNCMVINPTVNAYGTNKGTGAIVGALWYETNTMTNCYFYDSNAGHNYTAFPNNPIGSTVTRVARARKVTAGDGVTAVSPADASDPANGFVYNKESYYREGLELTLSANASDGYTTVYSANGTALDGSTYTVSSTDGDVTLTATITPDIATYWHADENHDGSTAEKAYIISTTTGLNLLASQVNSGTDYSNTYFQLGADITYAYTSDWNDKKSTENNYTTIGTDYDHPFKGYFDGQNHVISGIRVYKNSMFQGLFGYICESDDYEPKVENVILADTRIFGYNSNHVYVGGIVGYNYAGLVKNCHALSHVLVYTTQGHSAELGGIIGGNDGIVTRCTSAARIEIKNNVNDNNSGGIVGYNSYGPVSDCLYLGTTVVGKICGAIVGKNVSEAYNSTGEIYGTVSNCYSTNLITICGFYRNKNAIENCYRAPQDAQDNSGFLALMAARNAALTAVERTTPLSTAVDITLNGRTLYKDGAWNTLCLPFDATLTGDLADATLMELDTEAGSYEHVTGLDNGTLYLNFKDATSIEAGKPYIIKWDGTYIGDPIVNPVFLGVTINNSASTEVIFTGGSFKGTYKPIVWNEENKSILFLGDNNTLYWPQPEGDNKPHLNAFRAYFELTDPTVTVREFNLNFNEEETTSLSEELRIKSEERADAAWYTINGVKLDSKPSSKGIYIHGGRKTVIK